MNLSVRCSCGQVRGAVANVTQGGVCRVVCYCADCQAYAHHLGRADLLDSQGGTDLVQIAPASLSFDRGTDRIACLRLSEKGLYRWYATCCRSPLGNTVKPSIPFVGLFVQALEADVNEVIGPPLGMTGVKAAVGTPPSAGTWRVIGRALRLVISWKTSGQTWPHPFFDRSAAPTYPVQVLQPAERDALRPLCGPNPSRPS